jgi:peptide-methionine (S)-S-oxide reductase
MAVRSLLLLALLAASPLQASEPSAATFAGGCFWCVEEAFDKVDGVLSTTSGYANGTTENPTYEQVSSGGTGYVESLQVIYDPARVSYEQLLEVFWHNHDPTDGNGQFCDRGKQYRPAIFYSDSDAEQQRLAELTREILSKEKPFDKPIVTAIEPLRVFYPAEERHQDYHLKNPIAYKFYKFTCGRAVRLEELWGK